MTDEPEIPPQPPIALQPNPGTGILRFFLWLAPAGIAVACVLLAGWLQSTPIGPNLGTEFSFMLGAGGLLACGWFDSRFTIHCRMGRRSTAVHMLLFSLIEIFAVIPAVLFASLFAICMVGF